MCHTVPPTLPLASPPHQGRGWQQCYSKAVAHHLLPPTPMALMATWLGWLGVSCSTHPPCLPASPISGVDGGATRLAGKQLLQHPAPPAIPSLSSAYPSQASIVRDGMSASVRACACLTTMQAVTTAQLIALYMRCMASELTACVSISQTAGHQEITVLSCLPVPASSAATPAGSLTIVAVVDETDCYHSCRHKTSAFELPILYPLSQQ
jgi:hypothetical protein